MRTISTPFIYYKTQQNPVPAWGFGVLCKWRELVTQQRLAAVVSLPCSAVACDPDGLLRAHFIRPISCRPHFNSLHLLQNTTNPRALLGVLVFCANGGSWTRTDKCPQAPQACMSTSSITFAFLYFNILLKFDTKVYIEYYK